jgi:hypothetical protein
MESTARALTDKELMDALKHEGAMWFNNTNLLLLEELFRRYTQCKSAADTNSSSVSSK